MTTSTTFYVNGAASLGTNIFPLTMTSVVDANPFLNVSNAQGSGSADMIAPMGAIGAPVTISAPVIVNVNFSGSRTSGGAFAFVVTITINLRFYNADHTPGPIIATATSNTWITAQPTYNAQFRLTVPSATIFTSTDIVGFEMQVQCNNTDASFYSTPGASTNMMVTTMPLHPIHVPTRPIDIPSETKRDRTILIVVLAVVVALVVLILIIVVVHVASDSRRPVLVATPRRTVM